MVLISDHFNLRKLLVFALPSILSMIFTSLYTIVDGIFVSNLVGDMAFASLNLIWPPLGILQAIGFMMGVGSGALASKFLGEEREKDACSLFTQTCIFTFIMGSILCLGVGYFMPQLALFLGSSPELLEDCLIYGDVLCFFLVFCMLSSVFQSYLIAGGRSKTALYINLSGGFLNIILDYVLIAWFGMGIAGAALATGLNWTLTALVASLFFGKISTLHFSHFSWKPSWLFKVATNGSSEMVSNLSLSLVASLYNYVLISMIGAAGVISYGIIQYIGFVFVAVFLGYSQAITPIVGYHFGAGNQDELKNILKLSTWITIVASIGMVVIAEWSAPFLAAIFVSYSAELMELTVHAIRVYSICFFFAGFNILVSGFFTGLNNGAVSAAVSFSRTFLFQVLSILTIPHIFGLDGIWSAMTVSEICSLTIALILLWMNRKKYKYI